MTTTSHGGRLGRTFIVIGFVALGSAAWWATRVEAFIDGSETATGAVIRLERSPRARRATYHPVVRFTTRDGRVVTFISHYGERHPSHRPGDAVPVRYTPGAPTNDARVDAWGPLWSGPAFTGAVGAVLFLIGAVLFASTARESSEPRAPRRPPVPRNRLVR